MKHSFLSLFSLCLLTFGSKALAQDQVQAPAQPNIGCLDKAVKLKSEDVKQGFMKQGFTVYRDAMVGMQSKTPFPVGVKLIKGQMYQMVYVGNQNSESIALELFDGEDHKMATKKLKKGQQPDYIAYSFIPDKTDMYLVVLSQFMKHASMCGSFTILEKGDAGNTGAAIDNEPVNQNYNSNRYISNTTDNTQPAAPANTTNQPSNSNRYVGNTTDNAQQPAAAAPANTGNQPSNSNRYTGNTNSNGGNTQQPAGATPANTGNQSSNSNRYIGNSNSSTNNNSSNTQTTQPAPAQNQNNQTPHSNRYLGNTNTQN